MTFYFHIIHKRTHAMLLGIEVILCVHSFFMTYIVHLSYTTYTHLNETQGIHLLNTESDYCVICMKNITYKNELKGLPCKHKYHKECIHNWLQHNNTCPICREKI